MTRRALIVAGIAVHALFTIAVAWAIGGVAQEIEPAEKLIFFAEVTVYWLWLFALAYLLAKVLRAAGANGVTKVMRTWPLPPVGTATPFERRASP